MLEPVGLYSDSNQNTLILHILNGSVCICEQIWVDKLSPELCQGCQKKVNGPLQDGEEFLPQVEKFIWVLFRSEGKVKEEVDWGAVM